MCSHTFSKVATPYELTFLDPVPWRSLCEEYLDAEDIKEFKDAIEADYFFEMLIDELVCMYVYGIISSSESALFTLSLTLMHVCVYVNQAYVGLLGRSSARGVSLRKVYPGRQSLSLSSPALQHRLQQ